VRDPCGGVRRHDDVGIDEPEDLAARRGRSGIAAPAGPRLRSSLTTRAPAAAATVGRIVGGGIVDDQDLVEVWSRTDQCGNAVLHFRTGIECWNNRRNGHGTL
jgi:hypothetical protein